MNKSGFTLIELLVVISIIGFLSSAVMASLNDTRQSARESREAQTLNEVMKAVRVFELNKGFLPATNLPPANHKEFYRFGTCSGTMTGFNALAGNLTTDINPYIKTDNLNLTNGCVIYLYPPHAAGVDTRAECLSLSDVKDEFCMYDFVVLYAPQNIGAASPHTGLLSNGCVTPYTPASGFPQTYPSIGYMCRTN